jgi:aminomethyltransferase
MDVKRVMDDWVRQSTKAVLEKTNEVEEINIKRAIEERAKKHHGFLNVGMRADGSLIRLAVTVISGAEEGPLLAVDAGVHGDELEGTEAVIRVIQQLDPKVMRGTLVAVPALNVLAYDAGMRFAPSDQKYTAYTNADMNRVFPGDEEGSIQQRLADIYYRYIIRKADYIISFHGGGNKGIIGSWTTCQDYEGEVGRESMRMAKAFGLKGIWQKRPTTAGTLLTEAAILGKPAIGPEVGGDALRYPKRDFLPLAINGILNVMKELRMIDGEIERPDSYEVFALEYLKANHGGIFQFHIGLEDKVCRGDILGETVNLSGSVVDVLKAPWSGTILGIRTYPKVQPGDWLVMLSKKISQTPFISRQKALNVKIYTPGAWDLPMVYTSVKREYNAVRGKGAGLTDWSSMGKLMIEGSDAEKLVQTLFVNDFKALQTNRVCYTSFCRPDGRMIDDDTVYKFSKDKFLIVTSTNNREGTEDWMAQWSEKLKLKAKITNITHSHGILSLQGPSAAEILKKIIGLGVTKLDYFHFFEIEFENIPIIVSRTGITGELGFELYVPKHIAELVWDRIIDEGKPYGIEPVGIAAARILYLEKGYLGWGRDIDYTTNPLEAGLGWTVKFSKEVDFIGRKALDELRAKGLRRKIAAFVMDDKHVIPPSGTPKKGTPIVANERLVGHVTNSGFSYNLNKSIGLGYFDKTSWDAGKRIEIHIDGVRHMATVVERPFYDPTGEKLKTRL